MIRIAHVWSSDIGLALSLPHLRPLLDRGWEVYGLCPPGPRIPQIERAGVRWLPHPIERRLSARTDIEGLWSLVRTYRSHGIQIVHTHNAKVGILARVAAALARVPIIVHTHNGLIYSLDSRPVVRYGAAALERIASEVCDRIFVQSKDDYDCLVKTGGANERLLELVGNGIDMARFDPQRFEGERRAALRLALGIAPDDVLFFSAGRIVCEKGFVELFEAHGRASREDPRVRLAIAGPDDNERGLGIDPALLARARNNRVQLLGERLDMPELYAAADVVVLPSWREGIARVLMEGAAMGKPLIASDARGCRCVVKPGWGLVTPLRDVSALTHAMLKLTRDARLRDEIGRHNVVEARKEYDLQRILSVLDHAYAELLQAKGIASAAAAGYGLSVAE